MFGYIRRHSAELDVIDKSLVRTGVWAIFHGMTEDETEELMRRHFASKASCSAWTQCAQRLLRGSEVLFLACDNSRFPDGEPSEFDDLELDWVATLLLGYAIENAIKASIIHQRATLTPDRYREVNGWRQHHLGTLAREAGIATTADEAFLLEELSKHITWAGKYPVAFTFDRFARSQSFDGEWPTDKFMTPSPFDLSMRTQAQALFARVIASIDENS